MLEIYPSTEKERNNKLAQAVFGRACLVGVPFVLSADGEDAGIMELTLPPKPAEIVAVGILPKLRHQGYGDFFTRAMLLQLCEVSAKIEVAYVADYFVKFGFYKNGQKMEIESKNLVFPHECCK